MTTDGEHAPFLLLSIRGEDEAADDEYRAMMRFAGLDTAGMHRISLTQESLGQIDLADWSGVVLGGGPYNVSDAPESKSATQQRVESELLPLIDRIVEADFPFLGCCYGVGTLGSVIGATVDRTYPEPVGGMTITVTDAGRDDPLFAEVPRSSTRTEGTRRRRRPCPPMWRVWRPRRIARFRPSASARTSTPRSSTRNSTSTGSTRGSTSTRTTGTSHRSRPRL